MRAKTVQQRFDFGGLVDRIDGPEAWDAIRTRGPGPFRFPGSPADYERYALEHEVIGLRAEALAPALTPPVASYGVGVGLLEWHLARRLGVPVAAVTDYAPATVAMLQAVAQLPAIEHDLLADAPLDAATHLFHRVDAEFTNRQWRRILARYGRVLFVAGALESDADLKAQRKRAGARAGWARNERALTRLWARTHATEEVAVHDLRGWVLTRR